MNAFAVAMPASDWYIFLITLVLFLFGMWLIVGEVRSLLNRRADLYRTPPSGIFKVLNSIFRRSSVRPSTQGIPLETEKQSAVEADVTPEKAA